MDILGVTINDPILIVEERVEFDVEFLHNGVELEDLVRELFEFGVVLEDVLNLGHASSEGGFQCEELFGQPFGHV